MARNEAVWSSLNQWSEAELFAAYLLLATEDDVSKMPLSCDAMRMIKDHMGDTWKEQLDNTQSIVDQMIQFARTNSR